MKRSEMPACLLILGCGYVGRKLAQACAKQGMQVQATVRHQAQKIALEALGITTICNDNPADLSPAWLYPCDAVIDSIPLSYRQNRNPYQSQSTWLPALLQHLPNLAWAGYLSATSVYADSQGQWIDEDSPTNNGSPRGVARLQAEQAWLHSSAPAEVFRLAGIYGNDRNILAKLHAGNYKTVDWKPAHFSNRIHVDDIVAALLAAMQNQKEGRVINLCDDTPCSHLDYACQLAKHSHAPAPMILTPEQAKEQLSPTFLDFFRDNKRILNRKMHQSLLPKLKYASFHDALPFLKL